MSASVTQGGHNYQNLQYFSAAVYEPVQRTGPPATFLKLQAYFYRRSIEERGACFQRRLFVSLPVSVCLFVRTITSERLNIG